MRIHCCTTIAKMQLARVRFAGSEAAQPRGRSVPSLGPVRVRQIGRPRATQASRAELPILRMEQEIMEAVDDHDVILLCGETGCGKTTQVPQFLLEGGFGCRDFAERSGMVGVTQPRRVAAVATAQRVAQELGEGVGALVGHQVRFDRQVGAGTAIKFMTDGILMREAQEDPLLRRCAALCLNVVTCCPWTDSIDSCRAVASCNKGFAGGVMHGRALSYNRCNAVAAERLVCDDERLPPLCRYSVIVLDEAHERSLNTDILIGLLSRVVPQRRSLAQASAGSNDDGSSEIQIRPLKVIIMSATLRISDFVENAKLFPPALYPHGPPPVLHVPARCGSSSPRAYCSVRLIGCSVEQATVMTLQLRTPRLFLIT